MKNKGNITLTCVVTPQLKCPNTQRYYNCTTNQSGNYWCCIKCARMLSEPNAEGGLAGKPMCPRCKTINIR